ncbi:uncharacterized protein G2W53_006766 [Senna tora]|uniref:Uncharacterized protein n=1 Tax=Senna tora TaxID=362788 RepID=A0A834X591_9FABA|nr:uncharacterized protein G2W53_006766 [Senna tora]
MGVKKMKASLFLGAGTGSNRKRDIEKENPRSSRNSLMKILLP